MTFAELVETEGWKKFMAKLYGIGAAVVIVGALFKIMHWPFASLMLIAGLGTEAVIFFFSAFEPLHEEDDWSLVFPQLAGLEPDEDTPMPQMHGQGGSGMSKLDELLLGNIENGEELFQKLGDGLQNLTKTASALSEVSEASLATTDYTNNLKSASESISILSEAYRDSAETQIGVAEKVSKSGDNLVEIVSKTGEDLASKISQTGNELAEAYKKLTVSMDGDYTKLTEGSHSYAEYLDKLNKNLGELNAAYELQLQTTGKRLKEAEDMSSGMDDILSDLKETVAASHKYKDQVGQLGEKLTALNNVYGNMLTAMNVRME